MMYVSPLSVRHEAASQPNCGLGAAASEINIVCRYRSATWQAGQTWKVTEMLEARHVLLPRPVFFVQTIHSCTQEDIVSNSNVRGPMLVRALVASLSCVAKSGLTSQDGLSTYPSSLPLPVRLRCVAMASQRSFTTLVFAFVAHYPNFRLDVEESRR
jgi:hypothetical protein